jgi:activating signal cointegrator 1
LKALSLYQPWASLVALGVKTIETRSWSTSYRGPLAIHAGRHVARMDEAFSAWTALPLGIYEATRSTENPSRFPPGEQVRDPLPLGAIVATCTLVDVVPMVGYDGCKNDSKHLCIVNQSMLLHSRLGEPWPDGETEHVVSDQRPYGDFTPGRYAWLLADIKPLAEPIPTRGRQGLWDWQEAA